MANVGLGSGGPKIGSSSQGIPSRPAATGQNLTAARGECLPERPKPASNPNPTRLLANYFNLTLGKDPLTVYMYTFNVLGSRDQQLRGATARDIFKSALTSLGAQPHRYATDFQQQIVSLDILAIPPKRQLDLEGSAIVFENDEILQLDASVLSSPPPNVIDCLNLITGHGAREQEKIAAIGRHKFFPETNDLFHKPKPHDQDKKLHLGERFETGIPESLSVVQGFFQSVRPAEGKLFLNANSTFAVFRPVGNIGEICTRLWIQNKQMLDNYFSDLAKLHGAISKARVSYELPEDPKKPRPAKIVRIAGFARISDKDSRNTDPARALKFQGDYPGPKSAEFWFNDGHRTVWTHFQEEWGLKIDEDMPLINIGKPTRPEYVPAEYCTLLWGQPLKCKVTEIPGLVRSKLDDLNKFTCRPPGDNRNWIMPVHQREKLNLNPSTNQVLKNFGVSIDKKLLEVKGRTLETPRIEYSGKRQAEIREASWNMKGTSLVKGENKEWSWIYFGAGNAGDSHSDTAVGIHRLLEHLRRMCGQFPAPTDIQDRYIGKGQGIDGLTKLFASIRPNQRFLVVVCAERLSADTYNALKFLGDIRYGIHTSCILASKFRKKKRDNSWPLDDMYFANVALKINLKLGGINHKLARPPALSTDTVGLMVVGYDVTHPVEDEKSNTADGGAKKGVNTQGDAKGPGDDSKQPTDKGPHLQNNVKENSQVGLVMSADYQFGQWLSHYWNQTPRQEMTDATLTEAFVTLLKAWKRRNNQPKSSLEVVIYRDGVSESQFDQVLNYEVPKIREAYRREFSNTTVRLTLVIAIKRHTTRFFPTEPDGHDSKGNILPGTVVDNGVTQPKYWEFFLAAHSAIQGTVKPTRYVVVLDEIFSSRYSQGNKYPPGRPAEELETLTHQMSYLFGRATRAVGVCTPAYYADILCTRARAYMSALANPETLSVIGNSISDKPKDFKDDVLDGKINATLQETMYWI